MPTSFRLDQVRSFSSADMCNREIGSSGTSDSSIVLDSAS